MIQSIVLGIVQGLGEFLPISSSGHLIATSWLFNWQDQGLAFDVALHWGTLFAVGLYFRKDFAKLLKSFIQSLSSKTRDLSSHPYQRLSWLIVLATIPAAIFGYLLEDIVATALRNPLVVAGTLSVAGIILWSADYFGKKIADMEDLTWQKSLAIGLAQAVSVIPGVSRSGATMIAGLFTGLKRQDTARFSFLLSFPIILGAGLLEIPTIFNQPDLAGVVVGFFTAMVFGLLAIHFVMRYVQTRSFAIFAIYRLVLAGIILIVYFTR